MNWQALKQRIIRSRSTCLYCHKACESKRDKFRRDDRKLMVDRSVVASAPKSNRLRECQLCKGKSDLRCGFLVGFSKQKSRSCPAVSWAAQRTLS